MESHIGNIMTLSNSIIGVSILAMPFCFKQCGIVLAIVLLIASSIITRLTCHFLLKSAIMARRRTFELLAFHAFGTTGKFIVEVGIIGFLLGTCIAFFVIIGDLGPVIIAKMMGTKPTDILRTCILIGVALFFVLPLGLLRNVDSLHNVCTATIGFYFCLVLKTISESAAHFATGDWLSKVELWRPVGVLQCLPIFAMALACQTQLFEIYEIVANPTLDKMNYIVRIAVNICVAVYVCVGFFGYVAFSSQPFTGNILMSFSPSSVTDVMKIGFVLSVAFSFPLVIFPCRASLNSLLFRKGYTPYEGASNHIPGLRFKFLTALIVFTSLIIGILIPNIEVVLGLVGSTIGTMICLIFPVTCFICISTKNTNERLLAQILLFIGVIVMVMGTYANMYAMEEINTTLVTEKSPVIGNQIVDFEKNIIQAVEGENMANIEKVLDKKQIKKDQIIKSGKEEQPIMIKEKPEEIRLEPPQPVEPQDDNVEKPKLPVIKPVETKPEFVEQKTENVVELPNKSDVVNQEQSVKEKSDDKIENVMEKVLNKKETSMETKKGEEVDIEAIKKEDKELQEEEKNKNTEEEKEKAELFKKIEKHKEEQKSLLEEQKEILREIKKKKQELEEKKLENDMDATRKKAANQIMQLAKKAIERTSDKENTILKNEKRDNKKVGKYNDMLINDPVARQLLKMSNNSVNKTKTENVHDLLKPLPMAQNKSLSEILYQSKNTNDNQILSSTQQQTKNSNINHEIDTGSIHRNNKLDNVKQINGQEIIEDKVLKDTKSNDEKNQEKIENEIEKKDVAEVVADHNNAENVIPAKRDILANNESTDNLVRVKRESENDSTVLQNNDKCELEDKKEFVKTESPMMRLITEIIRTDVLKMNTNQVIDGLKNQLKADSVHLKRK